GLAVAVSGALAHQTLPAGEETPPPAARPSEPPAPKTDAAAATFGGRVLDPEGKPFAHAKPYLIGTPPPRSKPGHVPATSGPGGAFRLAFAPEDARRLADESSGGSTALVAVAEGYGAAFHFAGAFQPAADLTLRLAKDDVPVRGRVLDLQGKPLA